MMNIQEKSLRLSMELSIEMLNDDEPNVDSDILLNTGIEILKDDSFSYQAANDWMKAFYCYTKEKLRG